MGISRLCLLWAAVGVLFSSAAVAQEDAVSLGELARRERERKRNSPKVARVLTLEDATLNCHADWDCLLAAVQRKEEAQLMLTERLDLSSAYGTIHSTEIHVEIRDYAEDTAIMKAWPENSRLQISDRVKEMARASGVSPQQLELQAQALQRNIQKQDGLVATCVFRLIRLEEFIRRAKKDLEDESAWRLAERCDGLNQTITNPYSSQPSPPIRLPEKE